jgi:membrane protein
VPPVASPSSARKARLQDRWSRLVHIYQREIWQSAFLQERSLRGATFAVLRVISITATVVAESRIASRAAALSFSSLLGLGPLIAIAALVAGFAIGSDKPHVIADAISNLIKILAPQVEQYETLTKDVNQQLVGVISKIITASKSSSAGSLSIFTLLLIVLLLFKSIEDTFNDIWGVRQGRSVLTRIILYWTVLTLGALLFFSSVALLSASTFYKTFSELLPSSSGLGASLNWTMPVSFLLLSLMLTLFYRVIPNTRVYWRAALIGALIVAALLVGNNFVAFLYVKRVYLEQSFYGTLALPLVIMSGLYIFWLCVLTGGIVSYALQNVHFRNSQAAWSTLTEAMRERLALVVFLTICRRFRECLPPISASHLSTMLKVPTQLLNECLNRLVKLELVTTLRPPPEATATDYLYQPARPLNRLTLFDFKTLDDNLGENPFGNSLDRIDPLVAHYDAALNRLGEQDFFRKTIEELLTDHPFDESRPPFSMGQRLQTGPKDQRTKGPKE